MLHGLSSIASHFLEAVSGLVPGAASGSVSQDPAMRRLSGRFQVSLVWEGALVGLVTGLVIAGYRLGLSWAGGVVMAASQAMRENIFAVLAWVGIAALLVGILGLLVRWEPDTAGSGIPQVDAEVMGAKSMRWARVLPVKFVEGILTALGGLSLGREGPSVQLGGMVGKGVSQLLSRGRGEERLLVSCGAGAGVAAAFHAPLTGVMFTLEEIHKMFSAPLIISVMSSAVISDYVASQILGLEPAVAFSMPGEIPHSVYAYLVPMGVALGLLGAAHNAGMFAAQDLLNRVRRGAPYLRLALPFACAVGVVYAAPILTGGGDAIVELLAEPVGLGFGGLLALLFGKYLFTCLCFGSGAPGGTLFPLVVLGALCGALLGLPALGYLGLDASLLKNFMVLGIAGLFAGAVRAPVTAVVLAFELTGSLSALLSLSVVSIVAYVTANLCGVDAYYEHLLARLLGVSSDEAHTRWQAHGKQLHEYVVQDGSPLNGTAVADVSWPEHTLVVSIDRCGTDLVPHGNTVIQQGDRLLVLFASEASPNAEARVRSLCA